MTVEDKADIALEEARLARKEVGDLRLVINGKLDRIFTGIDDQRQENQRQHDGLISDCLAQVVEISKESAKRYSWKEVAITTSVLSGLVVLLFDKFIK